MKIRHTAHRILKRAMIQKIQPLIDSSGFTEFQIDPHIYRLNESFRPECGGEPEF
jgi:hypothetical protein